MNTEALETREYLENRSLEDTISRGLIRRPLGYLYPETLKKMVFEQYFSDDPLTGDIPKGWRT